MTDFIRPLTDWEESDPNGTLEPGVYSITYNNFLDTDNGFVRDDYGAGFFSGDFVHRCQYHAPSLIPNLVSGIPWQGIWGITNGNSNYDDMLSNSDGLIVYFTIRFSNIAIVLADHDSEGGVRESVIFTGISFNVPIDIWLQIERAGTVLTCKAYSDRFITQLGSTALINMAGVVAYRYLHGAYGRVNNASGGGSFPAYIGYYDLSLSLDATTTTTTSTSTTTTQPGIPGPTASSTTSTSTTTSSTSTSTTSGDLDAELKPDLVKWLRFTRIRFKILWEEVEDELDWPEDSISGVDLYTFSYSQLTSMKYALIDIIKRKHGIDLGRVDV